MVSIIMGVYNGEKTLRVALDSILEQTYPDWQFIICNDCSTDGSMAILKEYETRDHRILVIENENNSGLAASLNHCLNYVEGEYIARMDCDDISVLNRLERQVAYLEENPEVDLVGTYMQEFDEDTDLNVVRTQLKPTKYDLPKRAPFSHATIMIRTRVMKELNGYKVSKHTTRTEDVDLWYRFFSKQYRGENMPEALYKVRMDREAYKRRKLKYMMHASYIIWYGCDLVQLPMWYKIYSVKPIVSWILPNNMKKSFRRMQVE